MGYDARLPLLTGGKDGFVLVEGVEEAVKQDFMILLLTEPGERTMDPEFGVGLKKYLFENLTYGTLGSIEDRIRKQVSKSMSFLKLENIQFSSALNTSEDALVTDMDENRISISITYSFGYGIVDEITVSA